MIKNHNICKNNHLIIIHRENKSKDNLKDIVNIIITKKYGRSKVLFTTLKPGIASLKFLLLLLQADWKD